VKKFWIDKNFNGGKAMNQDLKGLFNELRIADMDNQGDGSHIKR
jgi:hypothetical protein